MTIRSLTLGGVLLLMQGCYAVKYTAHDDLAHAGKGHVHKLWTHSIFWGSLPVKSVPLDAYCADTAILGVKSYVGPLGWLAQAATLGIWTPSRVKITCADIRPPMIAAAQPPAPAWTEPEPAWTEPEPAWTEPEPAWTEPEPAWQAPPAAALAVPVEPPAAPPPPPPTPEEPAMVIIERPDGTRVLVRP